MLITDLPAYLENAFSYPVELDAVLDEIGDLQIEGPNATESETLATVLRPLGTDTFDSQEALFETIYGNVNEDYIGRKFYDDRGSTQLETRENRRDEENVSF